ncbi:MAG: hypothetical protein ACLS8R_02390 [Anaeromassilibacillus sp.]
MYPLSVSALLYVGKSARETLQNMRIRTIGDLAHADRKALVASLGKAGGELYDYANGLDKSPVKSIYEPKEVKSVGNGLTFKRNLVGWDDIRLGVTVLADTVAARMRRSGVKCYTVQLNIRNPSFKTISRQRPLSVPTFWQRVGGCGYGNFSRFVESQCADPHVDAHGHQPGARGRSAGGAAQFI